MSCTFEIGLYCDGQDCLRPLSDEHVSICEPSDCAPTSCAFNRGEASVSTKQAAASDLSIHRPNRIVEFMISLWGMHV